jgi:hypothetical protein
MSKKVHIVVGDGKRTSFLKRNKEQLPSTYTDFWNKPLTLGKKKRVKIVVVNAKEDVSFEGEARQEHNAGIVPSTGPRLKRATIIIKKVDKEGNVKWIRKDTGKKRYAYPIHDPMHDPLAAARNEPMDKYKQRLNMGFTSKKRYSRFTKNPREPRTVAIVEQPKQEENPISNVRFKTTLIEHVRNNLLKDK